MVVRGNTRRFKDDFIDENTSKGIYTVQQEEKDESFTKETETTDNC